MKIVRIFGVVLALHVVGGILFIQPGCQSQPRPDTAATLPATGDQPAERLDWDDWDEESFAVAQERPRSAPSRPASRPSTPTAGTGSTLQPLPSGLEPLTPVPGDEGEERTYTVRGGDSLWTIANRHNVSLRALLSANNLTEDSVIQPGQVLRLPSGSSASPRSSGTTASSASSAPSGTTTYTVRRGDSLSVIARRHNTTVQDLKALNNMTSDVIRIDQRLIVPDVGSEGARPQSSTPAPRSSTSGSNSAATGRTHTVEPGETPGGIASRYGISVNDLMSANNISDPRRMRVGQRLTIPGVAAETTAASAPRPSAPAPRQDREPAATRPTPAPQPSQPARTPTPRDIPVIPLDDEEEEEFPIIPIVPANG